MLNNFCNGDTPGTARGRCSRTTSTTRSSTSSGVNHEVCPRGWGGGPAHTLSLLLSLSRALLSRSLSRALGDEAKVPARPPREPAPFPPREPGAPAPHRARRARDVRRVRRRVRPLRHVARDPRRAPGNATGAPRSRLLSLSLALSRARARRCSKPREAAAAARQGNHRRAAGTPPPPAPEARGGARRRRRRRGRLGHRVRVDVVR